MAKQRTDDSRYPSRFSPGGFVTSAQYIIEFVCEKKARMDKKDLPAKFWELKEWSAFYKSQLRATHKLLKTYEPAAIIAVLKKGRIWSLRAAWVEPLIATEQDILNKKREAAKRLEEQKPKPDNTVIIDSKAERPVFKRSKLLSLDDEE